VDRLAWTRSEEEASRFLSADQLFVQALAAEVSDVTV
jgi:hypothetical protein